MKKGIFLLALTALLVAGWSGVWHFVSGKVETTLSQTKTRLAERGQEVECANQQVNGYPFRISVNCDSVFYRDERTGLRFEGGELKSAAQAYQPNKSVVELASPASLQLPGGEQLSANWELLRSSLKLGLEGPTAVSLQGKELQLSGLQNTTRPIAMNEIQMHGRLVGENGLNLAVMLDNVMAEGDPWPGFDFTGTVLLKDAYSDVLERRDLLSLAQTKGLDGTIQTLRYAPLQGGTLELKGPASINRQGLLSGELQITVRDLNSLIASLGKSFPQEKKRFDDIASAISLLPGRASSGEISLPVTVKNGRASVGIIPLGNIPPLF